jgi:hypothetical protein
LFRLFVGKEDIRWGADYDGRFVWTFQISGAVPASYNGGYRQSYSRASASWKARSVRS